eukprot:TRINITY_DN2449_c0_g1_i2.p1 TRINITY_DN2449_c0_g1~~TRINITY_DN2449_c0_g1_i2.p1  ORF type:complete len:120 (-),score=12.03 TRINITY_DN2449_c0_g1_i2:117-476(-)
MSSSLTMVYSSSFTLTGCSHPASITLSPFLNKTGVYFPSNPLLPGPTSTTFPQFNFVADCSGNKIPPTVLFTGVVFFTNTLSNVGTSFLIRNYISKFRTVRDLIFKWIGCTNMRHFCLT